MSDPIPPLLTDPADHTPDDRLRAVAAILAAGLLRLPRPAASPESAPHPTQEKPGNSAANGLAVAGTKSVTVHAG